MLHRSIIVILFTAALLLSMTTAWFMYTNWSGSVLLLSPWLRWLALFVLMLSAQVVLGSALWWLLRRRQQSVVRTEVLHSIVHEFQTPIAAIRMATDILDSPIARDQPERTEKYVRIIREETERLQQQVETMLTLARADRNTLTLNPEPILVQQLLRSVAERHGEYLRLVLPPADVHLLADRLHLTNVLHNLLDNAVKYSVGQPDISLQAKSSSDGLTISVTDRGVGIAPNVLTEIFQPFFRVHNRDQPSVKGFGLGLSYVQRIIKAHTWSIWVKSEVGQGSEFMIQIPPSALLPPRSSANTVSTRQIV